MNSNFETPILFLIFNRPDTTQEVFDQIKIIKPSKLYVAADGSRTDKQGEFEKCNETRAIINQVNWDCEVKTLFRDENLGCGLAVSSAISWFFDNEEYGIILEDDCLPSQSFFPYCEELLLKYHYDEDIMMVAGHNFQNGSINGSGSYFFSKYANIWGWASWRRAWHLYDYDMKNLDTFLAKDIKNIFVNASERKYWTNLLPKVKSNQISTWDYQWMYSIWLTGGLTITPNYNLIINLGFRNSATHNFLNDSYREILEFSEIKFPLIHPSKIYSEAADRLTFKNVYSRSLQRILRVVRENSWNDLFNYVLKRLFKKRA